MSHPSLSVIVISYNTRDLTLRCIESVRETYTDSLELIVVDNDSSDGSVEAICAAYPDVTLIERRENGGYAAAVNEGMSAATSELCLITNADVRFFHGAIEGLRDFMTITPEAGVAGLQQVYPDGSWQRSYGYYPGIKSGILDVTGLHSLMMRNQRRRFRRKNDTLPRDVEYIDGAIFMTRQAAFTDVGGFDESYFFYSEETDYCFRLRKKGWKNMFCPWLLSEHIRGASSSSIPGKHSISLLVEGKLKFIRKHFTFFTAVFFSFAEICFYSFAVILAWLAGKLTRNGEFWNRKKQIYSLFTSTWKTAVFQLNL